MKRCLLLLFIAAQLHSSAQSTFYFELEEASAFKDARKVLSKDSLYSPLIDLLGKRQTITLHPLYEVTYSNDNQKNGFLRWGLGTQLNYNSNKVNAGLTYFFNRGEYMSYRSSFINERGVMPGAAKKTGLQTIDAQFWDAYVSYDPNSIFNFEVGYGRKFIGSGHRSLLLSDVTSPYPYLKIQTKFWKLSYTNLFSRQLNTFGVAGNRDFYQQKFTASHFLELKLFKKLNIGLFETVIWQADEGSYIRGVDPNYLNPVIFYRPVEFSVGSSDNVIIGANIRYDFIPNYAFYFQALLDEFLLDEIRADVSQSMQKEEDIKSGWWGNKYGIQAGFMSQRFIGIEGLFIRLEYNQVRPYTYAHSSPTQAYSHNSIPLAHPLGANFEEAIAQLSYARETWKYSFQYNQSRRGVSPLGTNYGEEVEKSNSTREKEYENFIGQGISTTTRYFESSISKKFKFLWGAEWSLGYVWREQKAMESTQVNNMLFLSIKTNMMRQAFDY